MEVRRYDGSDVRRILVGMILDRTVCARVSSQWKIEGLFDADWPNLIGQLIVDHFRKHSDCPGHSIQTIFESWASTTTHSEKNIAAVERFLQGVSDESELRTDTTELTLDLAGEYFNKVHLEREVESAKMDLRDNRVDDAVSRLQRLQKVNLGLGSFVQPSDDVEIWMNAFGTDRSRPLFGYREDLAEFMGDVFLRGRFFSFMAADKTGKTTWLIDMVYRAVRAKSRVAFFDVGDAVEGEFIQRLAMRTVGKPLIAGDVDVPTGWGSGGIEISTVHLDSVDPISGYREFKRICGRAKDSLRTSFFPSSSVSAQDIDDILNDWQREGWEPDVVIIDYADILAPPAGVRDALEQIDETWKCLRRISQKRHCLVVTATQASSANYGGKADYTLGKKDFSGRKTKLAHVSGIIGINVNDEEREKGLARINKFAWRHGKHSERAYVQVAGCHEIGNPIIFSRFPNHS